MKRLLWIFLVTIIFFPSSASPSMIQKPFVSLGYSIEDLQEFQKNILVSKYQEFLVKHRNDLDKIPVKYRGYVSELCFQYNVPVGLLYNVVYHESRWKDHVISKRNTNGSRDIGLMQLNSDYLEYYVAKFFSGNKFNPLNGFHSLEVGVKYLADLHNRLKGDWYKVAIAYNYGIGRVHHKRIPANVKVYAKRIVSF